MIVLGLDPGLAHFGAAVVRLEPGVCETKLVQVLKTKPQAKGDLKKWRKGDDDQQRLHAMWDWLTGIFEEYRPEAIGIEAYAPRVGKAGSGGWKVAFAYQMGVCFGWVHGLPVYLLRPSDLRRVFLGKSAGSKLDINKAIREAATGIDEQLDLWADGYHEHMVDATGLGILAGRKLNAGDIVTYPYEHRGLIMAKKKTTKKKTTKKTTKKAGVKKSASKKRSPAKEVVVKDETVESVPPINEEDPNVGADGFNPCQHCGWYGPAEATLCHKCGKPMDGSEPEAPAEIPKADNTPRDSFTLTLELPIEVYNKIYARALKDGESPEAYAEGLLICAISIGDSTEVLDSTTEEVVDPEPLGAHKGPEFDDSLDWEFEEAMEMEVRAVGS